MKNHFDSLEQVRRGRPLTRPARSLAPGMRPRAPSSSERPFPSAAEAPLACRGSRLTSFVAVLCFRSPPSFISFFSPKVNNLREIQALRRLSPHQNIIKLLEVLYDQPTGRLALVFELMDMNVYEMIKGRRHYIAEEKVKNFMYQLIKAMDHMHSNGIFHRDVKPENILIMDDMLKVADFGSCRGIYSKQPYTEYISTRWYRAPECILTDGYYTYKMDMWGVGCVFFEIMSLYVYVALSTPSLQLSFVV